MRPAVLIVLAAAFGFSTSAMAGMSSIFGYTGLQFASERSLSKWEQVREKIAAERPHYRACRRDPETCDSRAMLAWQALLRGLDGASRREQLREVNRFANRWTYRLDRDNYGRSDYWASPREFLARSGDCEDYALFKYVSLRELGVPESAMRVVVLRDSYRELDHAVLAVRVADEILILDNVSGAVHADDRISHYKPYYSVNAQGLWTHLPPADEVQVASRRRGTSQPTGEPLER